MKDKNMTPIQKLKHSVSSGTASADDFAYVWPSESAGGHCTWHYAHKAYNGSIDAAVSLFEDVLPNWKWDVSDLPDARTHPPRSLRHLGSAYGEDMGGGYASRALLLAILKAMDEMDADSR